ncbi:type I-F CRISPR-associated protein Csy2 [Ferrimonas lipolytica]|uniref:Uncharacterized protein n=1 Tax=Ferrimonas lipolytica TaxID=2724191 RepID=A0A6H1U9P5_9GAMM|nr:type I-F CRISPR-associated protein Csy2 [Ferrimonas lipolytica]QIZ75761.1 hypothetical protein HER31_01900 [Ferrimonas lipolytica]
MHLDELLAVRDREERDKQLRRAFSPATALIEVSGSELKALTILCNLTFKRADVTDLLSVAQAKQALTDPVHFEHCVNEVKWFHSHNLKYPDSRVSHQRLILPSPEATLGVISSSEEPELLGWSHNSTEINRSKLFCTAFLMAGRSTCLVREIIQHPSKWLPRLAQRCLPAEQRKRLSQRLSDCLPETSTPNEVSPYSKQVRMFDGHRYRSLTPVVSHSLQSKIQQLANSHQLRATTIEHAHPAAVGDLTASQGGRVRALFYPPPVYLSKAEGLSGARSKQAQQGRSVFDLTALKNKRFVAALDQLIGNQGFQTLRAKRESRIEALRTVRKALAQWLAPVLEWRDALEREKTGLNLENGLERGLLETPQADLPELLDPLSNRLQEELQVVGRGKAYAYHPQLMSPLKSQLKWLLGQLAREDDHSSTSATMSYLHLSGLRVFDAQAQSNPYVVGIPSLSALWGLTHNFERRLTERLGRPIQIVNVAWFIRQYNLSDSKKLPEPNTPRKLRQQSEIKRPGILDSKLCDITMELVLKVVTPPEVEPLTQAEFNLVQAAFPSNFAGGCLQPPCLYECTEWCKLHTSPQELFDELVRLPRGGCWVYPTDEKITCLDDLGPLLTKKQNYRPVSAGFVALEELQCRAGSVESSHCYAEPAIGLVDCIGPIEVRFAGLKHFLENAFWHMDVTDRAMLLKKAPLLELFYGIGQTS